MGLVVKTLITLLLLLSLLLSFIASTVSGAANFVKLTLTDTNPDAVCNDGSPATYFFRAGSGSGINTWTIYQEGGGWCSDTASCNNRRTQSKHYTTSSLLPDVLTDSTHSQDVNHGGINSGDPNVNPHFYNANQVYVWYCSSDCHSGNRSAQDGGPAGMHFRGKVIMQTLIQDLLRRYKTSFLSAKNVLLLGFSAGAMGAMNNADFIGDLVKSIIPGVNYKTYMDSGWYFDTPHYGDAGVNRQDIISLYNNFYVQFNEKCEAIYKSSGEQWRCGIPLYAYPHIATPLFVAGYQYDSPFLGINEPTNATQAEYTTFMKEFFLMGTKPLPNFFSPNCWCHGVVAYDLRWNKVTVQNITASEMVYQWLNNGPPKRAVDACAPIGCNPTCSCIYNP